MVGKPALNGIKRQLYLSFLIRRNARKQVKMQTCRGNWSAAPTLSRLFEILACFSTRQNYQFRHQDRFPTSESLPCCSDSPASIIHPSAPLYPFLFFRLLFLPDAEETAKEIPSFDVLSLVSPSSSLFPRPPLRLPKINREKLAAFLPSSLSLSLSVCLFFHCRILLVFTLLFFPLQSSKRQSNRSCCSRNEKYLHSSFLDEKILYRTMINVSWGKFVCIQTPPNTGKRRDGRLIRLPRDNLLSV